MSSDGRRHEEQVRIFLRPIGSALPLGFFSFGIGMLLLGTQALGWIPLHEQKNVGMMLVAFGFPLELVATIVAFLARATRSMATTLGLFTTSWVAISWADIDAVPGALRARAVRRHRARTRGRAPARAAPALQAAA